MSTKTKRSAPGSGSIRKRSDGRWEARYTVGHDPVTGKQNQKSIYSKTQKEVRQKRAKVTAELDEGTYLEPAAWLSTWLETYVKFSVKPYTFDSYTRVCEKHIDPVLGSRKLSELNPIQIQQFYNRLLTMDGLSPKTIIENLVLTQSCVFDSFHLRPYNARKCPISRSLLIIQS